MTDAVPPPSTGPRPPPSAPPAPMPRLRTLLVANFHPQHMGSYLLPAVEAAGVPLLTADLREGHSENRWLRAAFWRLLGRRPVWLGSFSKSLARRAIEWGAEVVLATGIVPLRARELADLRRRGVVLLNILSDDPFNPLHRAPWFLRALAEYDVVFNPRRANMDDLRAAGARRVDYLPFAFDDAKFRPEEPGEADRRSGRFDCDVLFVGGADADRIPWIRRLAAEGFRVHVYGGYWERVDGLPPGTVKGEARPDVLRVATGAARVSLCLVRKANRDGHVMRSLEIPASGGCLLAEDTPEHRDLFGPDGVAATYFRDPDSMVAGVRRLLADEGLRARLRAAGRAVAATGGHTYADRLRTMLTVAAGLRGSAE